jgi:hypothetical protein
MKTFGKVFGIILVCLVVLVGVLRVTGLEPKDRRPGLWLKGDLVTEPVTDWSFVSKYATDRVQTRTWYFIPHSVNTGFIVYNNQFYLTSAFAAGVPYPQGKSWVSNVYRDPHVRLKFGNQLFDRTLSPVTDPAERASVLQALAERNHQQTSSNGSTMHLFHVLPE